MCRTWKEPRCCRIQLSYWSVFWTIRGCSSSRRLSDRIRSISLWTQLGSWVCLNACSSIFLQLVWIRCINVCVLQLFNAIIIIPLTFSNSIQSNRLYEKHNNDVNIYLEDTQYREVKSKLKSNRFKDGSNDLLLSTRVAVIFRLMSKCLLVLFLIIYCVANVCFRSNFFKFNFILLWNKEIEIKRDAIRSLICVSERITTVSVICFDCPIKIMCNLSRQLRHFDKWMESVT